MTVKKRSLLLSVMTFVLSIALFAAGTYALFSDQVTLTNHLQAGTLDITLKRTKLTTATLNADTGFIAEEENSKVIDFSIPWDENHPERENKNVFDLTDKALIIPCCWYSADMQITNNSDVAFGYWLEIVFDDKADLALADQLQVTVTTAEGTTAKKLSESAGQIGKKDKPISVLAKKGSALFTVRLDFLDLEGDANNAAKKQALDFDIVVHAVQVTTAPPNP